MRKGIFNVSIAKGKGMAKILVLSRKVVLH